MAAQTTFDEAVMNRLRLTFDDILLAFPEVKALAGVVTWNGALNDAKILHAIWRGADGPVTDAAGVVAGMFQTLKLLEMQFGRAIDLVSQLRDQIIALSTELLAKREEILKAKQSE